MDARTFAFMFTVQCSTHCKQMANSWFLINRPTPLRSKMHAYLRLCRHSSMHDATGAERATVSRALHPVLSVRSTLCPLKKAFSLTTNVIAHRPQSTYHMAMHERPVRWNSFNIHSIAHCPNNFLGHWNSMQTVCVCVGVYSCVMHWRRQGQMRNRINYRPKRIIRSNQIDRLTQVPEQIGCIPEIT